MPTWDDAVKEAFASCPKSEVHIHTLQISHSLFSQTYWFVRQRQDMILTLETGQDQLFKAAGFQFTLPEKSEDGLQDLNVAVDNVDKALTDELDGLEGTREDVKITYRMYLSSDLSKPVQDPPLTLSITDVKITTFSITGRASFQNFLRKQFLTEHYNTETFPTLGD
ncbi:MAG: DUF1833 family protein [Verrucomicrobiota bacterium]